MAVITISRQFGAGGKTLGEIVSKKLGYSFIDREIIQMVAKKAKVSTHWVEFVEKEAGGRLSSFMNRLVSKRLINIVLDDKRGRMDEEIFVDLLYKIIIQIADEENAVILGRGGQYVLSDREDTFHVLLIAHQNDRIKFMQDHYKLTRTKALQAVNKEDKRRINLYRKFGKADYDHPDLYHLVLNMSKISLEKACNLIAELVTA